MPRILLVEDDEEQADLFARVLRMAGYDVVVIPNAGDAQARLAHETFDLLLADWDLGGGMQGDALIGWTRAFLPAVKTILFSNHPQVDEVAHASGADAAFRKMDGIVKLRQLANTLAPMTP